MVIPMFSLYHVSPMVLNFQDPVASVCVSSEVTSWIQVSERVEGAPIKNLILIVRGKGTVLTCVYVEK